MSATVFVTPPAVAVTVIGVKPKTVAALVTTDTVDAPAGMMMLVGTGIIPGADEVR